MDDDDIIGNLLQQININNLCKSTDFDQSSHHFDEDKKNPSQKLKGTWVLRKYYRSKYTILTTHLYNCVIIIYITFFYIYFN